MRKFVLFVAATMFGVLGVASPAMAAPVCTTHAVYQYAYPHTTYAWITPSSSAPLHRFKYGVRQANGTIKYVSHSWTTSNDSFPGHATSVSVWQGASFCGTVY